MRDDLLLRAKEMHPSFESLTNFYALGFQAFFMDIHHNTSFRSILEDDSIPSTSRADICSCSSKASRAMVGC